MPLAVAAVLAAVAPAVVRADTPPPVAAAAPAAVPAAKRELIEKLFEICDMKAQHDGAILEAFDGAIAAQAGKIPRDMKPGFEEGIAKVRQLTVAEAGWEAVKDTLLALYAAEFSEEELRAAVAALEVPAAREFFRKRTRLGAEIARMSQARVGELQAKVAAIMSEAILGSEPAPAAEPAATTPNPEAEKIADEIRKGMDEIVGMVMKRADMGQPTAQETAKIAGLSAKCAKLARTGANRQSKRDLEGRILNELPFCFEGDRQRSFRQGLIKLLGEQKGKAQEARVAADIMAITTTLEMYKLNAGIYPTAEQGLQALIDKPGRDPVPKMWVRMLDKIPLDPWGNPYRYRPPGGKQPGKPEVFSAGPDGKDGTADDLTGK